MIAAVGAMCTFTLGCDPVDGPTNWSIQTSTLTTTTIQEDGFLGDGDEPYIATISFRSTPGVPGSTSANYLGGIFELSSGAEDGDVLNVPPPMGRATFSNVMLRDMNDVLAGNMPEVVGTVTVVMESDATPFGTINNMMDDLEAALVVEVGGVIEPMTLASLANADQVADDLEIAANNVADAITPSFWDGVGIWLTSFTDPDDIIGVEINLFVAAKDDLAIAIDQQLGSALPAGVTGGALDTTGHVTRVAGDDAVYHLRFDIQQF